MLQVTSYKLQENGFSLIEILLAASLFSFIITALVGAFIYGQESTALSGMRFRAELLAEEGLEAARNIRDENFANLNVADNKYGLVISGNQWIFSGTSDATGIFTRQIIISTIDANRKQIISNVSWQQTPLRSGSISLISYLTNWRAPR